MRRYGVPCLLIAVVVAAIGAAPALAETRLVGVSLGQTPSALMASEDYGSPAAMIAPPLTFNPMTPPGPPTGVLQPYARAVTPASLGQDQVEWVYTVGKDIALGFIFTGRGPEAQVTDIIVSIWNSEKATAPYIRSERGITLGNSFRDVLLAYGYPPLVQVLRVAPPRGQRGRTGMALPPGGQPAPRAGALPPVTVTTNKHEAVAMVGLGNQTFTQHCILSYPGVNFTLYKMRVVRIHIYEPLSL